MSPLGEDDQLPKVSQAPLIIDVEFSEEDDDDNNIEEDIIAWKTPRRTTDNDEYHDRLNSTRKSSMRKLDQFLLPKTENIMVE